MNLPDLKADFRKQARHRRRALHEESGQKAALGVVTHGKSAIADLWGATPPGTLAGYLAVGSELDAVPLMNALAAGGWMLALPVVMAPSEPLVFRRWRQGEAMTEGAFGILQPDDDAPEVRPDIVLAPLLAFDDDGYRLGQGGGFYDRTLAKWNTERPAIAVLGLGFAGQRVDAVPRDEFDQRLTGMITEDSWFIYGDEER